MRPRLQFFLCSGALAFHSPSWTRRIHLLRDGSPARSVPHGQDGLRVASSSGAGPWRAHPAASRPRGGPWVLAQSPVCPAPPHVSLGGGGRPLAAPWEVPTARPPPSSRAPCRHLMPSAAPPGGLPVRMDGDGSEQTSFSWLAAGARVPTSRPPARRPARLQVRHRLLNYQEGVCCASGSGGRPRRLGPHRFSLKTKLPVNSEPGGHGVRAVPGWLF